MTAPRWRTVYRISCVLAAMSAACGSSGNGEFARATATPEQTASPTPTVAPTGTSCNDNPDPHCDQPLNRILIPMLRDGQWPIRDAAADELCRRLAVDLLGRIPTVEEQAVCTSQPHEETVGEWLDRPEHERVQRRFWASELGYEGGFGIWWTTFDFDELVGRLARDEIRYDDFATLAIIHPAFFGPRLDDGWGAGVFNVFLGRPPRRDEMDGTRPLARMFTARQVCDGRAADNVYRFCLEQEAAGELDPGETCAYECPFSTFEPALDRCRCTPDFSPGAPSFGCAGDGLGEPVDLGVTDCEPGIDLRRGIERSAGQTDRCSDRDALCPDLVEFYLDGQPVFEPAMPLPEVDPEVRALLETIGPALTARGDFWDAAADRELRRLLGWWHSGFRKPDFDVPVLKTFLADELRRTGSLRHVQRLVLTSLLYTAPAAAPDGTAGSTDETAPPPWAMGPAKLLGGETWLDSVQVVSGEVLGTCDHRFISSDPDLGLINAQLTEVSDVVESTIPFADIFPGDEEAQNRLREAAAYARVARGLGGCQLDPRARAATLAAVSTQSEVASFLCAIGRSVAPPGLDPQDTSDDALTRIARHLGRTALSREPDGAALDGLREELRGCIAAGRCSDAEVAARWLCARLVDSTLFALY